MRPIIFLSGFDHNCGHILLRVVSKSRPLPAYRAGEAGSGRDGSHDVMIKPAFLFILLIF